jgi:peroxiredoxin
MRKVALIGLMLFAAAAFAEELAVGAKAPAFSLVNAVDGATVEMKPDDGKWKIVVFTCNQCTYAKAFEPRLIEIANRYTQKGVRIYAVNPNDASKYAEETLDGMKARAIEERYPFPYLKDADSSVARAYGARVTPHVFLVDGDGTIQYRGYIDDSAKPEERKTAGLTNALNLVLDGRDIALKETRAFGCGIKWAPAS